MQVRNETADEAVEIINPFVKAMKDQRLDNQWITSLRKETITLIEPFREITTQTAQRQDLLEETFSQMRKDFDEFQFQSRSAFKTFASLAEVKQRDNIIQHELVDLIDTQKD